MTHINEDKRKAEGQVTLFNIFNDIDNCPVSMYLCLILDTEFSNSLETKYDHFKPFFLMKVSLGSKLFQITIKIGRMKTTYKKFALIKKKFIAVFLLARHRFVTS